MQENEKYGIELEAKTNLFKKGLQEAINYTKAFGKGVKDSFSDQVVKSARNWRSAFKEAFTDNGYIKELETLKTRYKETLEMQDYKGKQEDLKYYESEISRVQKLIDEQKEYNEELKETEKTSNKTTISLGGLFDRSIGKIKRFTYYLLGARSVFSLFMKYRNIYYQYNEEMQYQSELSQNAIALSLAPAFELLGNVIAYASIGFAKFIELLTGVNVLSKVSTKGIRDYNKSLKESQSLLSGIDEITNLTLPSSTGLASQYNALNDFQDKVKEVEKWFDEHPWIQKLADTLQTIWEWGEKIIDKVGGVENALILLGGVKVMSSLGKLIGVAGGIGGAGATGLLGILSLCGLISVALLEISRQNTLNKPFTENINNLKKYSKEFYKNMNSNDYEKTLNGIDKEILSIQTKIQSQPEEYEAIKDELDDVLDVLQEITGIDYKSKLQFKPEDEEGFFKGIKTGFKTMLQGFGIIETENDKSWEHFKKSGKDAVKEMTNEFGYLTSSVDGALTHLTKNTTTAITNLPKVVNSSIKSIQDKLKELTNKKYTLNITTKVMSEVGKGATSTANVLSQAISKMIRGYANGLDYVPYDNYPAVLHKGEAVVPAKYNPTIHSQGNEYTNSLLETLVMKVDDLSRRPNVFEIDGQKFANATYNLYDNARSRQNYVEGVVR